MRLSDWRSAPKTIEAIREVADHGPCVIDGVFLDGLTAGLIVQVYDALNADNRAHLMAMPIERIGDACWRLAVKVGVTLG